MNKNELNIAITDDHQLVREGIARLLADSGYENIHQFDSGEDLLSYSKSHAPDLVLLDINMPGMGGISAAQELKKKHPKVRVIAMTALDDDINVIRMLRAGAKAYVLKSATKLELAQAVHDVIEKGYHFSDLVSGKLIQTLNTDEMDKDVNLGIQLSDKEIEFIKYLCTELTNKEIADKMFASPRTTEGWRKNLCEKLNVNTRVGIVLWALRNKVVE